MIPAWLSDGLNNIHWQYPLISLIILIAGMASLLLSRKPFERAEPHPKSLPASEEGLSDRRGWLAWAVIGAGVIVSLNVILLEQQNSPSMAGIHTMDAALKGRQVTLVASTLFDSDLLDLKNSPRIISMNAPTKPTDPQAQAIWRYAVRGGSRMALVTWFGPGDPANWQEQALWRSAYFVRETDAAQHRIVSFNLVGDATLNIVENWHFSTGSQLNGYTFHVMKNTVHTLIYVSLDWSQPTRFFIHLLDAKGNIISQQDRWTWGGYSLTNAPDRLILSGPSTGDWRTWQLRIGVLDPRNDQIVNLTNRAGKPLVNKWVIVPLTRPGTILF